MNIRIESNFSFSVSSIQYAPNGELQIILTSDENQTDNRYQYTASLGNGKAEEKPTVSLLQYCRDFVAAANIKPQTRSSYHLMCRHLEAYGDVPMDKVTTAYLQEFIPFLHSQGLQTGTVRLYFQKLTCILHDAYKNELFDDRILQRVKRPPKKQSKKCFLTETDLKKLTRHKLSEEYSNIQAMFLFSCMTGLRFGDVKGLRWKDVKRNGKHLQLEFHQQKTDTYERVPLCAEAEALLRSQNRSGEHVFKEETNQQTNKVIKKWCEEAKVKKPVTFHSGRHTFCVLLLTKDVPIYTVQQLMCHSDIGSTKVYADLLNKTKAKAVRKLPVIMC